MDYVLYELVCRTARLFDRLSSFEVRDLVSTNTPSACEVADRDVQIHGGTRCTRHMRCEQIYRHHRRCMAEQREAVQIRTVAAQLLGLKRGRV